jgi:L-threonylcarbamoyladenylate synthase
MTTPWQLRHACRLLHHGGVIAYPTEAVYGLGCDPADEAAVMRLLAIKQRPWQKGLILVAADYCQLQPWIAPLDSPAEATLFASWPGPNTWLLPAAITTPRWLTGNHDTLAVRVTDHPLVIALCNAFGGALVSTSANQSRRPAARSALAVRRSLNEPVDLVLHAPLGGRDRPSTIRRLDGAVVRR